MKSNMSKSCAAWFGACILVVAVFGAAWAAPKERQPGSGSQLGCGALVEALADSQHVKPGALRKEVERHFRYDGGMQFLPGSARYAWLGCGYLKLDVEYDPPTSKGWESKPGKDPTTPDDKVRKVSKLYVDYPIKD